MDELPYPEHEYVVSHKDAAQQLGVSEQTMYSLPVRGLSVRRVRFPGQSGRPNNYYHPTELEELRAKRENHPYRTDVSELEIQVAIRMYEGGKGLLFCRRMLGVGISRLYQIFKEHGVEIRSATRPDQRGRT